jgi:Rod binding domain-containing protein
MTPIKLPPTAGGTPQVESNHGAAKKPDEQALKAAREFESLLLRHMLEAMQKTAHIGAKESNSATAYQSMAVEALADGVERGGGLGLADLVAKSLQSEIGGKSR